MKVIKGLMEKPWPYMTGAIILALLNFVLFISTGLPWKITSGFLYFGAGVLEMLNFNPREWYYFSVYGNDAPVSFFLNRYALINTSVIIGALIAALLSTEFKIKPIKSKKQLAFGFLGGILMGFGTRLSFGCNIGSFFSAIPAFSLHGWIYGIFMFVGAYIGSKILLKYLL
jgi:uncharacterized membrane protein YedE/YeeE